jgi:enamine deaminase RidA (YjgF/YER057c/UK114 family)
VSARRSRERRRTRRSRGASRPNGREPPRRAEAGSSADAILRATIYVVADERADLVRVWDVVTVRLGRAPSTLLGVSFLGYPDQLVEIEAIAVVDST